MFSISSLSILQEGNGDDSNWTRLYDLEEPQSNAVSPRKPDGENKSEGKQEFQNRDGMKIPPFEFVALEACLEAACGVLENEVYAFFLFCSIVFLIFSVFYNCISPLFLCHRFEQAKTLEQEAHPALDKLTSKISTLNLERVRQIKSRLVAITGRVQKVGYFFQSLYY